jgi:hypothetical protein
VVSVTDPYGRILGFLYNLCKNLNSYILMMVLFFTSELSVSTQCSAENFEEIEMQQVWKFLLW